MSRALLDNLLELAKSDANTHAWLSRGIALWSDGEPLDVALGLTGRYAVAARNRALETAANLLDPMGELTPWKRAELLEKAILRYEARPMERRMEPATELDAALFDAFRACDGKMIRTQRKLYEVIR